METPEACIPEEPRFSATETMELLTHALNDYAEDIPENIVHGSEGAPLRKCQKNWFSAVVILLETTQGHLEYNGDSVPEEIVAFRKYYTSPQFLQQKRVTRQDINYANTVIKRAQDALAIYS